MTLLQTAGLIKLDVKDGELATIKNISENPKKLDIKEIAAEQAAQTLSSVDAAVVNNSYAQQQNVDYDTTLFQEDPSQDLKIGSISLQLIKIGKNQIKLMLSRL